MKVFVKRIELLLTGMLTVTLMIVANGRRVSMPCIDSNSRSDRPSAGDTLLDIQRSSSSLGFHGTF